ALRVHDMTSVVGGAGAVQEDDRLVPNRTGEDGEVGPDPGDVQLSFRPLPRHRHRALAPSTFPLRRFPARSRAPDGCPRSPSSRAPPPGCTPPPPSPAPSGPRSFPRDFPIPPPIMTWTKSGET